jgi:hypothetical protein
LHSSCSGGDYRLAQAVIAANALSIEPVAWNKRPLKNNRIDAFVRQVFRAAAGCHVALCCPSGHLDEISFNFDDFCHYNEI